MVVSSALGLFPTMALAEGGQGCVEASGIWKKAPSISLVRVKAWQVLSLVKICQTVILGKMGSSNMQNRSKTVIML